ncbi:MAG: cobalt transporter CbiM, partial [Chthonomonadales bacterium]
MHIPDTAISPITSAVAIAAMAPVWNAASRRLRKDLDSKQVPLLAISAAFCFTIMMFNIPVPGGTTVHPVGGVLMAILLGPWAAVIGVTTALIIQSLFFGDGGVLAIGANCFTMAFAMPFAGYLSYRLICGKSPSPGRTSFAAGAGAYIGLNVAALLTAVILGIQPSIAHEATGQALYFPFGLHVTVPAIMAAHLLVAGFAEAITTGLIVRYALSAGILQSHRLALATKKSGKLWIALAGLAALTPLGLLAKGDAWGEWGVDAITKQAGYTP